MEWQEMRGCDEKVGGKGRGEGGVDLSFVTKRTRNDAGRETAPIQQTRLVFVQNSKAPKTRWCSCHSGRQDARRRADIS